MSAASATSNIILRDRKSGSSIRGPRAEDRRDSGVLRRGAFKDWTHADTGAPVLKAQHPEFEMWNQGIHARSGVTCADCHMPYKREGALKISDHHVRSPVLNINRACQTCHSGRRRNSRRGSRRFRSAPTSCGMWRWMR